MLGFLNSFILPALAAAALPILIHLFNKRKTKTVPFSSLRFLKMLESKRIRQLRIYEFLLILIRTLFIVALVLAFARPTLESNYTGGDGADVTAIIVLDDSYSMQTYSSSSSYFQQSKSLLKRILSTFSDDDKVFILLPGQLSDSSAAIDLKRTQFVDALEPGLGRSDFEHVLLRAEKIFKEQIDFNQELYFISDFRINQNQLHDSLLAFCNRQHIRFIGLDMAQEQAFKNVGIDTAFISTQIAEQNKPINIVVRLRNHFELDSLETRVHLFQGDQRLAMQSVKLSPAGLTDIELAFIPRKEGLLPLHLELDNDDLDADNFYYLQTSVSGKTSVLFVAPKLQVTLETALNTLNEQSLMDIKIISFADYTQADLNAYDLLVLYDPPAQILQNNYKLSAYCAQDNALIIIPGKQSQPQMLNALMQSLSGTEPFRPLKSANNKRAFFSPQSDWANLPMFKTLFSNPETKIFLPEFYKYYPLQPAGRGILKFHNDDVLLTLYPLKNSTQYCYLFSSSFEPEWTNLALNGIFVPFLHRLFSIAGHAKQNESSTTNEQMIKIPLPALHSERDLILITPDASSYPLNVQSGRDGLSTVIYPPLKPGHYWIKQQNLNLSLFSVNYGAGELERPYFDFASSLDEMVKLIPSPNLEKTIQQRRNGQELWLIFAALAFLLLVFEILIIKRIEGKYERTSP